jgi:hypothetical protein
MPKTQLSIPLWYDDFSDDLRAAGPAVMLVACYLHDSANSIGFYHLAFAAVSRATGVPLAEVQAAMPVLEQIGFLRYHVETQMVWLINYALRNLGPIRSNDKKGTALANAEFAAIPEHCQMRLEFLEQYGEMLRLDVDGSAVPNGASFETEVGGSRPDF